MGFRAAVPHSVQQGKEELAGKGTPNKKGFSWLAPFEMPEEAVHQSTTEQPEAEEEGGTQMTKVNFSLTHGIGCRYLCFVSLYIEFSTS